LRERSTLFEGMSALKLEPEVMSLAGEAGAERVYGGLVSGNFFDLLGTRPAAGRFFLPDEDRTPNSHPVVVLSHAFWQRRFNADEAAVGRTLTLSGRAYTVVGVAEAAFTGTTIISPDFWVPFAMEQHVRSADASMLTSRDAVWHFAIGRLRPGVSMAQ